jgi:hypothetical protein
MKRRRVPFIIFSVAAFFVTPQSKAAAITLGSDNGVGGNAFPFGLLSGSAIYSGRYQQIYASQAFSQPFEITYIAFASTQTATTNINYTFTLSFGLTNRTPANPGSSYSSGTVLPVFSGSISASITPETFDFDLMIPLGAPFIYDPALGNLLLDINLNSATGPVQDTALLFSDASPSPLMGRIFNLDGYGEPASGVNEGLVTQFTGNAVPEPPCAFLLISGVAFCLRRHTLRQPNKAR